MSITLQNNVVLVQNEVRSFPHQQQLSGTVTSSGTVVTGTGTDFRTELLLPHLDLDMIKYKYIFHPSTGEIREILDVPNITTLILKTAFNTALTGQGFFIVDALNSYRAISIDPMSSNIKFCSPEAAPVVMTQDAIINLGGDQERYCEPIGIYAIAGTTQVTTER